jgi:deoxyribonuclease-4
MALNTKHTDIEYTKVYYTYGWPLGSHIALLDTLEESLMVAIDNGMKAVQLFVGSPQSYSRRNVTDEDCERTGKLLKRYPCYFGTHAPYILNLCAFEKFSEEKGLQVVRVLEEELTMMARIQRHAGSKSTLGVVVHIGSHHKRVLGCKAVSSLIDRIEFPEEEVYLLLENSAGEGNKLGRDLLEIKGIIDGITDPYKRSRTAVCIDTCHYHAAGESTFVGEDVDSFFAEFDSAIGLDKLKLIHLNDSCHPKGACKDRHARLMTGHIWSGEALSLLNFLDRCSDLNIPLVLETTPADSDVMAGVWADREKVAAGLMGMLASNKVLYTEGNLMD